MNRALIETCNGTKILFQPASNAYRYALTPARGHHHAVLKLQTSRANMRRFQASTEGRAVSTFADVFEMGGGWYEITSADLSKWNEEFGTNVDGLKVWLKAWNLDHLRAENANPQKFQIVRRRAHLLRSVNMDRQLATKGQPVWPPTPEERRNQQRLESKLGQLAQKFNSARR